MSASRELVSGLPPLELEDELELVELEAIPGNCPVVEFPVVEPAPKRLKPN